MNNEEKRLLYPEISNSWMRMDDNVGKTGCRHKPEKGLGMVNIPPMKMVMTAGLLILLFYPHDFGFMDPQILWIVC